MLGAVKTGLQGRALYGGTAWLRFQISLVSLGANIVSIMVAFLKRGGERERQSAREE